MTDAELDDIQRDAVAALRSVGVASGRAGRRAAATVALVAEVRRLRSLCREAAGSLTGALECIREDVAGGLDEDEGRMQEDLIRRLRAAGGKP